MLKSFVKLRINFFVPRINGTLLIFIHSKNLVLLKMLRNFGIVFYQGKLFILIVLPKKGGGVLLGLHPASPVSLKSSIQDPEGRYIIAECYVNEEFFMVAAVYFAPSLELAAFEGLLKDIASKIDFFGHPRVVWVGDFNVSINPNLDATSVLGRHNIQRDKLLPFMDAHELIDVWRAMHPFDKRFT